MTTVNLDDNDVNAATLAVAPVPASPVPSPDGATRTSDGADGPRRASTSDVAAAPQRRDPKRYQILGEHGRGGLGRVSRAHDVELGRDIAIKELISRGHVAEVRFLREALITARLEHPGIVPVHEAGRWPDGTPFYAMKLVAGRPLHDLIAERPSVDERIGLLHHVIAVADSIAYAHGRHIIHRDLKPANVIVGEFGETVVIDWGLAKDLSMSEEPPIGGGPFREQHDDGLTSIGTILGTPAYMAPEQARGESVDQRADVYAIGLMLWELCSRLPLPRGDAGKRRRILRRAGIDQDLATIIDKAVDADPDRRYADAGALAADLKAFKAGARIGARRYSPWAVLTHWTRRHRALSLSIAAALVLVLAGSAVYVRNIAIERQRAITSERAAERAKKSAEASLDALTLKHAELLLGSDPTATLDALVTYHGADTGRARQLSAEARGRGVARLRATPHTDAVHWIRGNPDGSVVSFSVDGTIAKTSLDGTTTTLAKDVVHRGVYAYSTARQLLAYACDPANICVLDLPASRHHVIELDSGGAQLAGVDFSPNGMQLASISQSGELRVFDIADLTRPSRRARVNTSNGVAVLFVATNTIAVGFDGGLKVVHLGGQTQEYNDPDGTYWDADTAHRRLAIASTRGEGLVAETDDLRITKRAMLCHDDITGLRFLPGRHVVAYICHEGTIGLWDLVANKTSPRAHVEGHAQMIEVSEDGEYVVVSSDNGVLTALDLSADMVTSFRGHGVRLVAIAPPTREHPFFLSGDMRGAIRAWEMPIRAAKVVARDDGRFRSAVFSVGADAVIASALSPKLAVYSVRTAQAGLQFVAPHDANATFLALSEDGDHFATYGASESVEIWSSRPLSRSDVFETRHGSVTRAAFAAGTSDLVTAGRDGRLVRWSTGGASAQIMAMPQPIVDFALAARSAQAIVATADGALWRAVDEGHAFPVKRGNTQVTAMRTSPDAITVMVGYANGDLIAIDTTSWRQALVLHAAGAIRHITFTTDDHRLAVADAADTIHVGDRTDSAWTTTGVTWTSYVARARDIAFTSDGLLAAVCAGGIVWLYAPAVHKWLYLAVGTTDLTHIALTADSSAGVVFDDEGRVISIDVRLARNKLMTELQ